MIHLLSYQIFADIGDVDFGALIRMTGAVVFT